MEEPLVAEVEDVHRRLCEEPTGILGRVDHRRAGHVHRGVEEHRDLPAVLQPGEDGVEYGMLVRPIANLVGIWWSRSGSRKDEPVTEERDNVTLEQVKRVTRRRLLRTGLGAAAAVAASPLLAACGSSGRRTTIERLRSNGAKLGLSAGPPSASVEGGKAIGIFPEVAEVVLRRLGVDKFTPVLTSFDGIIPGLQAGRVDLAVPGLYITAERCKAILFSHPVVMYADALVVAHGNPHNIKTIRDVAESDLKMGTIQGSVGPKLLRQEGIPTSRQVLFPDFPSALDGLKAGRADVAGSDLISVGYMLGLGPYKNLTLIPLHTGKFSGAIGFAKNATDLQTAFNEELRKAQADGALAPIYKKWKVPKEALAGVEKLTWEEQCRVAK